MANMQAFVDDFGKVTVVLSRKFYNGETKGFYLTDEEGVFGDCLVRQQEERENGIHYELTIPADLEFGKRYTMHEEHGLTCPLQFRFITKTKTFDELFTYERNDLGATYHKDYTDFVLWAPTAVAVTVRLTRFKQPEFFTMRRNDRGVYRVRIEGDLKNATYVYLVERNGKIVESLDPYGLSSTANGAESAIIDLEEITSIPDEASMPVLENPCKAIIYECSIRDMTSHPLTGTKEHRTFNALMEKGTSYKDLPTGLDYLSSLGVTHVQFQPVLDFATVDELAPTKNYNWGYDPLQLIALEGSFTSKPQDPYARMKEFKTLVATLHERGIRVNLDIVWNHMYDTNLSCLDKTVPYYYYRYNDSGYLSNGSFCGNDLDSQKPMMRKLFYQSIKVLLQVYGVDGFRFDLMGILDIETMNEIVRIAKGIKRDAMIYGEGWDMPTALSFEEKATLYNQAKMPLIGHFNDLFRDVLKGRTNDDEKYNKGYLTGDLQASFDACSALLAHSVEEPYYRRFISPSQSINAIETHDNATVWDKMHYCCEDETREVRLMRQKMMIAVTLLAQGVPFIHAGMEFGATKNDVSNSYMSGDEINGMNWQRAVRNRDLIEYTKACIRLRRYESLFSLETSEEIKKHISLSIQDNGDIFYDLTGENRRIRVIINPSWDTHPYTFGEPWQIALDGQGYAHEEQQNEVSVPAYTVLVLTHKGEAA